MAYRRRQGVPRSSTFKEEEAHDNNNNNKLKSSHTFTSSSSLAAQALRATASHRSSSSSPHHSTSLSSADSHSPSHRSNSNPKIFEAYEGTSPRKDAKGFWGVLTEKAKSLIEDDKLAQQLESASKSKSRFHTDHATPGGQIGDRKIDSPTPTPTPTFKNSLNKITTSLNHIGDTFERAYEEGRTRTADIIQETRKFQIRRKGSGPDTDYQDFGSNNLRLQPLAPQTQLHSQMNHSAWQQQPPTTQAQTHNQMNQETQLKASRDVAMATAAKAKLLLRELKTVKADLAFAKQRCSQLEEENRILRESREKGGTAADDDLIRLQLETLLAEKARLAHENSIYSRENRFLREIVEYHQLTMQDVVYLNECSEEVSEVYPITKMLSISPPSPLSPSSPSAMKETIPCPQQETLEDPESPQTIKEIISGSNPLQNETSENSECNVTLEDSGSQLEMKEVITASNPLQETQKVSESNVLQNVTTHVSNAAQEPLENSGSPREMEEPINTPQLLQQTLEDLRISVLKGVGSPLSNSPQEMQEDLRSPLVTKEIVPTQHPAQEALNDPGSNI